MSVCNGYHTHTHIEHPKLDDEVPKPGDGESVGRENVGRSETGEWDHRKPARPAAEDTLPKSGNKCQINNFVGIYITNSH
jgi:hypothetical protein